MGREARMKRGMKIALVDAAVSQRCTFTLIRTDKLYVHLMTADGYVVFSGINDGQKSVEINNCLADLYEEGRKASKAK